MFSQHFEVSIHLLFRVSRSRHKIAGNNLTAIFDSKMAADLAVADNSRVTTDGEIILCTLQNLRGRFIGRNVLKAGQIALVASHGCCQDNLYDRRLRW